MKPYRCPAGALTIGYGWNIDANPLPGFVRKYLEENGKITKELAEELLDISLTRAVDGARSVTPVWEELNSVRQAVIASMVFNLGLAGWEKFTRTRNAITAKDFDTAADCMLESKWSKQVGNRAVELAKMMRTGTTIHA